MAMNIHVLRTEIGKINGKSILEGDITLKLSEIDGADKVQNTADNEKEVKSAGKLTAPVKINGVDFDGSQDITIGANDTTSFKKDADVELAAGKVVILTSTGGKKFKISVSETGNLTSEEVAAG